MAKTFNLKSWIINTLRRSSMRYPPANQARNRTKETYYITSKKGKQLRRVKYTCELCGKKDLKSKETELDHTIPVVGIEGFVDWNTYISRMFVQSDGYKLLCSDCHMSKTKLEMGGKYKERRKKSLTKKKKRSRVVK